MTQKINVEQSEGLTREGSTASLHDQAPGPGCSPRLRLAELELEVEQELGADHWVPQL